jgi:glycolate oxidase FAD binding subunit
VRYVSAEGKLVRAGGPTVKNVTGFDLPRLIVGSLGTIGCIAEVILRTNPVPSVAQWYVAKNTDAFEARDVLLRPSAVLWDGSSTWVLLEGHSKDVQNQAATLSRVGRFEETDSGPDLPKHRWSLAPSDLRTMSHFDTGNFVASIGVGTVYGDKPQPPRELSAAVLSVTQRIKENFDPIGRLNPGRMVGGL